MWNSYAVNYPNKKQYFLASIQKVKKEPIFVLIDDMGQICMYQIQ